MSEGQNGRVEGMEDAVRHHCWATVVLLHHCSRLPPGLIERPEPGSFGSILETLQHLGGADERMSAALAGVAPSSASMEAARAGLPELLSQAQERGQRWEGLISDRFDLDRTITRVNAAGQNQEVAARVLLLQAVVHGGEHRSQICSILGRQGLDAPGLDAWAYHRAH
ncbi:MAG: DinB family protein, partial [Candidatus Dormibacteraceae bacterium]